MPGDAPGGEVGDVLLDDRGAADHEEPTHADDVLGVETQLWSETLRSVEDVELMTFPRLPGVAEVGWSPAAARRWDDFRRRLAAHGPRWSAMAVRYHRSPQVPWPD